MKPYVPTSLPIRDLDHRRLITSIGEANAGLGRYDGLLQEIADPIGMLSPLTVQEAVLSSRLEGIRATVGDVYGHEAGLEKPTGRARDIQEVVNYREALRKGQEHLSQYPIGLSLVQGLHRILLESVRGQDRSPGRFRETQNWIGLPGSSIEDALFVPPVPFCLPGCLDNWLSYLAGDDVDVLVQAAVMHAQFELIHPFKDGNGRIGRLLIPLFLYQKKRLSRPMFYLSSYLESHREEYYHRLREISRTGEWNGWIEFFLRAIVDQAKDNLDKVKRIRLLYDEMKTGIQEATRSRFSILILDRIFNRPVFRIADFVQETGMQRQTASTVLRQLRKAGILVDLRPSRGRRAAVLCFPALLDAVGETMP